MAENDGFLGFKIIVIRSTPDSTLKMMRHSRQWWRVRAHLMESNCDLSRKSHFCRTRFGSVVGSAGINFRDVLLAFGMYPGTDVPFGAECAGIVTEIRCGRQSNSRSGTASSDLHPRALLRSDCAGGFPCALARWHDAEDAAGLPVAFFTADYGLNRLARLRRGQRMLIHAAAGGVGLAAVQLAQRQGAEIFATAGFTRKA